MEQTGHCKDDGNSKMFTQGFPLNKITNFLIQSLDKEFSIRYFLSFSGCMTLFTYTYFVIPHREFSVTFCFIIYYRGYIERYGGNIKMMIYDSG